MAAQQLRSEIRKTIRFTANIQVDEVETATPTYANKPQDGIG
jgi:hypothetical protein